MSDYGITAAGFVIKNLQTIKDELEAAFKASYGNDLDVSEDSNSGQLIGNLSKKFSNLWELLQSVYTSFSPGGANDVSLDNVAALVAITRLAATSSTATVALYGTLGTVVPVGHLIRQDETNEDFGLDTAVTISASSLIDSEVSVDTVLDSTLYTVTINGHTYTYTSDGTATALEIIAGLKVSIDAGSDPVTVTDNLDGTMDITSDDGIEPFSLVVDANLSIDTYASPGEYSAINTGVLSVPANTLTTIVNPISGLDDVNNIAAGLSGRNRETDQELRTRRRELVTGVGAATDESIRTAILQEVDGVTTCIVISNRSDVTDGDGRPPHSFEAVVSGGDEDEIAEKIWQNMPSGIQATGDITKTVTDSTGTDQTIKFSRPTTVYVWVDIEYELNPEEDFPENGEDLIKQYIVEYADQYIGIGDDVIRQRLSIPIYDVPGIGDITIELASTATPTPPGSYAAVNITIAADEIASFSENQITVAEAP